MSLWRSLDGLHGWIGTKSDWRRQVGGDLPALLPLLVPLEVPAGSILLDGEPRRRRVVIHADDDIVAIDDETDSCVAVAPPDVVVFQLKPARLGAQVSKLAGLTGGESAPRHGLGVWWIGDYVPFEGERLPVYMVLERTPEARCAAIAAISAAIHCPFIVALLHAGQSCGEVPRVARAHRAGLVSIELLFGRPGSDALPIPLQEQASAFLQEHIRPTERALQDSLRFPTPPGTSWEHLVIKFIDSETATATCRGTQRRIRYSDLGLEDGRSRKPDSQWKLLYGMAQEYGIATWSSDGAGRKRQKHAERLNEGLVMFFGIAGPAIAWDDELKGWRCSFRLEPEG